MGEQQGFVLGCLRYAPAPQEPRGRVHLAREPGEVALLPGGVDVADQDQGRVQPGAAVRFEPRVARPVEGVEKRLHRCRLPQGRQTPERMARTGVEQLEGRNAVGGGVNGVMGRLAEEPVFRVLEALERIDPGASLLGATRQAPEGVEKIHRIRAAIGIEAEVARARGIRARPAGVCARRARARARRPVIPPCRGTAEGRGGHRSHRPWRARIACNALLAGWAPSRPVRRRSGIGLSSPHSSESRTHRGRYDERKAGRRSVSRPRSAAMVSRRQAGNLRSLGRLLGAGVGSAAGAGGRWRYAAARPVPYRRREHAGRRPAA